MNGKFSRMMLLGSFLAATLPSWYPGRDYGYPSSMMGDAVEIDLNFAGTTLPTASGGTMTPFTVTTLRAPTSQLTQALGDPVNSADGIWGFLVTAVKVEISKVDWVVADIDEYLRSFTLMIGNNPGEATYINLADCSMSRSQQSIAAAAAVVHTIAPVTPGGWSVLPRKQFLASGQISQCLVIANEAIGGTMPAAGEYHFVLRGILVHSRDTVQVNRFQDDCCGSSDDDAPLPPGPWGILGSRLQDGRKIITNIRAVITDAVPAVARTFVADRVKNPR